MFELNSDVQQYITDSLTADRWQIRKAKSPNYPGSWVLVGPQLSGRLVMTDDVLDRSAWLSVNRVVRPEYTTVAQWQLVVRFASADMVLAMARVAETASDQEPVAWSTWRLHRRLRVLGWRRSTAWLRAWLGHTTEWVSPDGAYRVTVSTPSSRRGDEATVTGPDVHVSMAPTTPVAVVAGLAGVVGARPMIGGGDGSR